MYLVRFSIVRMPSLENFKKLYTFTLKSYEMIRILHNITEFYEKAAEIQDFVKFSLYGS